MQTRLQGDELGAVAIIQVRDNGSRASISTVEVVRSGHMAKPNSCGWSRDDGMAVHPAR